MGLVTVKVSGGIARAIPELYKRHVNAERHVVQSGSYISGKFLPFDGELNDLPAQFELYWAYDRPHIEVGLVFIATRWHREVATERYMVVCARINRSGIWRYKETGYRFDNSKESKEPLSKALAALIEAGIVGEGN